MAIAERPAADNNNNANNNNTGTTPNTDWIRMERTVAHVGKVQSHSKRRVEWVLEHGPTHTVVRITLVWSLKTGKYIIAVNDVEQVFERRPRVSVLDHAFVVNDWSMWTRTNDNNDNDNNTPQQPSSLSLRVVAAQTVPTQTRPFKQYDLLVNGVKYHDLPKTRGENNGWDDDDDDDDDDYNLPSLLDVVVTPTSR